MAAKIKNLIDKIFQIKNLSRIYKIEDIIDNDFGVYMYILGLTSKDKYNTDIIIIGVI